MHTITTDPWSTPLRTRTAMKIYLPKGLHDRLVEVVAGASKEGLRLDGRRVSISFLMRLAIAKGIRHAETDPAGFVDSIDFELTRARDVETNLRMSGGMHRRLVRTAGRATVWTGRSVSAHCLILSMLATGLRTPDEVEWDALMAEASE